MSVPLIPYLISGCKLDVPFLIVNYNRNKNGGELKYDFNQVWNWKLLNIFSFLQGIEVIHLELNLRSAESKK